MSFTGRSRKACDDCFGQQPRPDEAFNAQGDARISPKGQVLASWGSEGTGDGQFRTLARSRSIQPIRKCGLPIQLTAAYRSLIQTESF